VWVVFMLRFLPYVCMGRLVWRRRAESTDRGRGYRSQQPCGARLSSPV
jgi:hypothetical protein